MHTRFSMLILATTIGCSSLSPRDELTTPGRRQWRTHAIKEINCRTINADEISKELTPLKSRALDLDDYEGWLSDHLILMKNGEWLCYESTCAKEESRIDDLFLARGSDGNWYSTFHFCVRMLNLKADEQPESLAQFVHAYSVRAFDVRSDECLRETWPKR